MKVYFFGALMLVCTSCFAQKPTLMDDLATGMDSIVAKCNIGDYKPDPVQFNQKIEKARNEAYRQNNSGDNEATSLKHLDIDYFLRNVLFSYRKVHLFEKTIVTVKIDAQKQYVDSLIYSNAGPDNETLFKRSSAYRDWIDHYLVRKYQTEYQIDTTFKHVKGTIFAIVAVPIRVIAGEIQNPFIRDYECYKFARFTFEVIRTDSVLARKIYQDFNASVTNAAYREEIQQLYDAYRRSHIAGTPAADFTYDAVDGKKVTLSNLRGKYVYIDIWSTTCPNCIEQFPYLTKIEDEYKGKNIQFVSLSLDAQSRKDRWRKYVTDHKLTGYQLISDKDVQSDWVKKLNIFGIPRFILIDPAGDIVDGDAKRPSDPALKKQFDQLLK